ncbi:Alpha/beta-Hydrolases superfamily protein, putative [Theobroma cacao]|uniref:Alpha/beta-Hydrolases superfamily protein, putative n=1 Tax=Theobroma cacao TaxID=3641 RepID=A0A061EPH6_THECC|nr:Alpha/beta-Hydrolases superfamily protein, putative [Theobroma cacao]
MHVPWLFFLFQLKREKERNGAGRAQDDQRQWHQYARSGERLNPVILFLHRFAEPWYCWRHQIIAVTSLGYRAVAPDLRGHGDTDTDAPEEASSYTSLNVVGDLIGLLDAVAPDQDRVFIVGHVRGILTGNPLRVSELSNGDDYYICRFQIKAEMANGKDCLIVLQEPGVIEAEFLELGTERVIKGALTIRSPDPLFLPKGKYFGRPDNTPFSLPSWLSEEVV